MYVLYKRSSMKYLIYVTVFVGFLILLYYMDYTIQKSFKLDSKTPVNIRFVRQTSNLSDFDITCSVFSESVADIDTADIFPDLDFNPFWLSTKNFWDNWFDARLQDLDRNSNKLPLKVILVPHSHNDPGWLETFQYYLQVKSSHILNNVVDSLQINDTFKFIWAEVAFLEGWWKHAGLERRSALRRLIKEGQIEIVTGGWVMPDEAVTTIYGLIDQYIEGHQWLKRNLDVKPKYGWSIDVFGHSSTIAYLLSQSGIEATVIQRIHYAWKYWMAYQRTGDFHWVPNYISEKFLLTHNQPFYLYDISSSCGPTSEICNIFNYYSHEPQDIYIEKFIGKLDDLINEYRRSGSLYKHNVVLVPIGQDFSYVNVEELLGNYGIYSVIIKEAKKKYPSIDISFGTLKDYFEAVLQRQESFPSLKGDFFVYADPFSLQASYWSGYYSTRPYLKILVRILEAQLRTCEILYSITLNYARYFSNLKWSFERIVDARRILDLFQHHDAITGTSKSFVVKDYITRLTNAVIEMLGLQRKSIEILYGSNSSMRIVSEDNIEVHDDILKKRTYKVAKGLRNHVILFNSLLQSRNEFVRLVVSNCNVKIENENGFNVPIQISPVWKYVPTVDKISSIPDKCEVSFIATIPALTVVVYQLHHEYDASMELSQVFSNHFHQDNRSEIRFVQKSISTKSYIKFDNSELSLYFSGHNGFLRRIHKKSTNTNIYAFQEYVGYNSYQYRSGPYLFQPDPDDPFNKLLLQHNRSRIMVIVGNVYNEMIVIYKDLIVQKTRIYHTDTYLSEAIFLESTVNIGLKGIQDLEIAMRFVTNINNNNIFYTDSNGFQMQKRITVEKIGVEGNYYPVTSMMFIEDDKHRLTVLTSHSLGGTSYGSGQIEVMLDRKMSNDDNRGLDEGISDNRKCTHKFILVPEVLRKYQNEDTQASKPTYFANHLSNSLNFPLNIYIDDKPHTSPISNKVELVKVASVCNVHLVNFRTQPHYKKSQLPSRNAFLVLQEQVFGCDSISNFTCSYLNRSHSVKFNYAIVKHFKRTSLSGIEDQESASLRDINEMFLNVNGLQTYNVTFR